MHDTHTMGSQCCCWLGQRARLDMETCGGASALRYRGGSRSGSHSHSLFIQPLPAGCLHRRHHPNAHAGLRSAKGEETSPAMTQSSGQMQPDFSSSSAQVSLAPVLTSSAAFTSLTPVWDLSCTGEPQMEHGVQKKRGKNCFTSPFVHSC